MRRAILLLLAALLLTACAPAAVPDPAPTPAATEQPTPAPVPTPYVLNPAAGFYVGYEAAAQAELTDFCTALAAEDQVQSVRALMWLYRHMAALSKAKVSIGRLSSSGGSYADTLIGPASGAGTLELAPRATDAYRFSFLYEDGTQLSGTLGKTRLEFTLQNTYVETTVTEEKDEASGDVAQITEQTTRTEQPYCYVCLYQEAGAWSSCVYDGTRLSALSIQEGSVRFTMGETDAPPQYLTFAAAQAASSLMYMRQNGVLTYSVQNHS